MIINRTSGWLSTRAVPLLMSLRPEQPPVWLTRHGESEFNVAGRIGGDAPLSERGRAFAKKLAEHFAAMSPAPERVFTSTLRRTRETADLAGFSQAEPRRDMERRGRGYDRRPRLQGGEDVMENRSKVAVEVAAQVAAADPVSCLLLGKEATARLLDGAGGEEKAAARANI